MSKKRRKRRQQKDDDSLYGDGFNRKEDIAEKFPFKFPIIEHLVSSTSKLRNAAAVLTQLKMRINPTHDGRWFDVVEMKS